MIGASSSWCSPKISLLKRSRENSHFLIPSRVHSRPLLPLPQRNHRGVCRVPVRSTAGENFVEKWKRTRKADIFWEGFDVLSVAGTVSGALLVLLGYDVLFVTLPIGLPVVSLFIGLRRERQKVKMRDEFDAYLLEDLTKQREALERVKIEIGSVSTEIKTLLEGKMRSFEDKLNQIEATVMSTSQNVHKTSNGLRALPGILRRISEVQQKTVIYAVSSEFRALFEKWGETQLHAINRISQRISLIEESLARLESYETIPGATSYTLSDPDAVDVTAEKKEELKNVASSLISDMKDVLTKEVSSAVSQLKDNQVDMMQSFRDVKLNEVPQVDYFSFANQLQKIESALKDLPKQMSNSFKSDENSVSLQDSYAAQFTSVSTVLTNLETAIEELKKATVKGQSALEMKSLENKWIELRSLMQSLGQQISGVNDRVEKIITNPYPPAQEEEETEPQSFAQEENVEEQEPLASYLEFQETTMAPVPAAEFQAEPITEDIPIEANDKEEIDMDDHFENEDPSWEVIGATEEDIYSEIIPEKEENDPLQEEKDEVASESELFSYTTNGATQDALEEVIASEIEESSISETNNGDVSTVGNMKLGLELLKKGRVALEEDYGEAYKHLTSALKQFESILEVDPMNVRCLGNCGNTLFALGQLKIEMAKDLEKTKEKEKKKEKDASGKAVEQLEQEAQEFLILAGHRFKTLLLNKEDDKRAYMNWGKALCLRSQLTKDPILKMQLYDAAIVKYEKVLQFAPDFVHAMFFCGAALKESSEINIGSPMDMRNRISQAIVYFEDVERLAPSSPLQFEAFQMKQQCFQSAQSPTVMY